MLLFLLFTVVPVVELWLLIRIGGVIGAIPTIAGVLLMGAIGASLAKSQGRRVLREWQAAIGEGRLPTEGILEGALVLVGGVLLITPGVLTDVVGFALLIPPTRKLVARLVRWKLQQMIATGSIRVATFQGFGAPAPRGDATGRVVGSEDVAEDPAESPPSKLLH